MWRGLLCVRMRHVCVWWLGTRCAAGGGVPSGGAGAAVGDPLPSGLTSVAAELGFFRGGGGAGEDHPVEIVRRRGRWLFGKFVEFTSRTPSPTLTCVAVVGVAVC